MTKKLLIVTDTFLPRYDGISSFLREVIPRLQDKFEITVIAPDFGPIKQKLNIQLIRFKLFKMQLGDQYPSKIDFGKLKKAIRKTDIVWVQSLGTIGTFTILIAKGLRKPIVHYTHLIEWEVYPKGYGNALLKAPIHTTVKLLSRLLFNRCDLIMTSSLEISELLTWMRIYTKKKIIHLGVDSHKFTPTPEIHKAKEKLGISKDKFVIGYVGRLAYEKDLRTLYRAFIRFHKVVPESILLIVGTGREDIRFKLSDKNHIILAGAHDNVVPYYQAMDIYVLSSLTETTSLTTLEAMSCGLAVVTTQVGYITEYIKNSQNGIFFKKKDTYDLYRKLLMLYNEPNIRNKLGKNACETILKEFSWDKTVKEIEKSLSEF